MAHSRENGSELPSGYLEANPSRIRIDESVLEVPGGETLNMVGGDIDINGGALGKLRTPDGQILLTSVTSPNEVSLHPQGQTLDIEVNTIKQQGKITLSNVAFLDVSGSASGRIRMVAGRVDLRQGTIIQSRNLGIGEGGSIDIHTGTLHMASGSMISTSPVGPGPGGAIRVTASEVISISGDPLVGFRSPTGMFSSPAGAGSGGKIVVSAPMIMLENSGLITAQSQSEASGRAGDISVTADRLILQAGARIDNSTRGVGRGGTITVVATDAIRISGRNLMGLESGISSATLQRGDAGAVFVSAPVVHLEDGGSITASTRGTGKSGVIDLQVDQLILSTGGQVSNSSTGDGEAATISIRATNAVVIQDPGSGIISNTSGQGSAGRVRLSASSLLLENESIITTQSRDLGQAGIIEINVETLTIRGGAQIENSVSDVGAGNRVDIHATESITIIGSIATEAESGIRSSTDGIGHAGDIALTTPTLIMQGGGINARSSHDGRSGFITIEVDRLTLSDGARISNSVEGEGAGARLTVNATDEVRLIGDRDNHSLTGLLSQTGGGGHAGEIAVKAPTLTMVESGITTQSNSSGRAGTITLSADQIMLRNGAVIDSNTFGAGAGGMIQVTARKAIQIEGQSRSGVQSGFRTSTSGPGHAGRMAISTSVLNMRGGGLIAAQAASIGNAGVVEIHVDELVLTGGAQISGSNSGDGDGRMVTVIAENRIDIVGQNSGLFTRALARGEGGDVVIQAGTIGLVDGAMISAESTGGGSAGNIVVLSTDSLFLENNSTVTTGAAEASGGKITLDSQVMIVRDGQITTSVIGGDGTGGDVAIKASVVVLERSQIRADAFGGPGGNVTIQTDGFLTDVASVVSASSALNVDGTVNIQGLADLSGSLTIIDPSFASATTLQSNRCARRLQGEGIGRFTLAGRDRLPTEPGDLLPSPSIKGAATVVALPARQAAARLSQGQPRPASTLTAWHRDCVR